MPSPSASCRFAPPLEISPRGYRKPCAERATGSVCLAAGFELGHRPAAGPPPISELVEEHRLSYAPQSREDEPLSGTSGFGAPKQHVHIVEHGIATGELGWPEASSGAVGIPDLVHCYGLLSRYRRFCYTYQVIRSSR